jgi:hypothetical protein
MLVITDLFDNYLEAFKQYKLDDVVNFYHLPCTLNTPDKVVLISTVEDCKKEFLEIFSQLKAANTIDIVVKKSSYTQMNNNVFLACVDWEFIDGNGDVFADFCAYYHLLNVGETECKLKIINVNSHELSNSLPLALPFKING